MAKFVFNPKKCMNDWQMHFLMHLMTKASKNPIETFKLDETDKTAEGLSLDVEIKINGIEVQFDEFVLHLSSQFEEMVSKEAKRLLKEQMNSVSNALYDLERKIEQKSYEIFPDSDD